MSKDISQPKNRLKKLKHPNKPQKRNSKVVGKSKLPSQRPKK
jgi:hypothetical protein